MVQEPFRNPALAPEIMGDHFTPIIEPDLELLPSKSSRLAHSFNLGFNPEMVSRHNDLCAWVGFILFNLHCPEIALKAMLVFKHSEHCLVGECRNLILPTDATMDCGVYDTVNFIRPVCFIIHLI